MTRGRWTGADTARRKLLGLLLYSPSREIVQKPGDAGLEFRDLVIETEDAERLHGWWIAAAEPSRGHVLLCHGNGGNIGDRVLQAHLLCAAGLDVLSFDYRGYGHSSGKPDEQGTYRDARAARKALLEQPEADPARVFYLGESLGGAVALHLAVQAPPKGLILQSTFTSIRELAQLHYPRIPPAMVADAYPSLRLIPALRAPLLVLHGDLDDVVPLAYGRALFDAAAQPKQMHVFSGLGHNDLVSAQNREYTQLIADWARAVP